MVDWFGWLGSGTFWGALGGTQETVRLGGSGRPTRSSHLWLKLACRQVPCSGYDVALLKMVGVTCDGGDP